MCKLVLNNSHTLLQVPTEGVFGLNPPTPLEIPVLFDTFLLKVWLLRCPPPPPPLEFPVALLWAGMDIFWNHKILFYNSTLFKVVNYDGVSKNVTAVGFHEDGKWMFTGGEDCSARIWDLRHV